MIYRIAVHNLGNTADAEDIMQEYVCSADEMSEAEGFQTFKGAWLIRVTIQQMQ